MSRPCLYFGVLCRTSSCPAPRIACFAQKLTSSHQPTSSLEAHARDTIGPIKSATAWQTIASTSRRRHSKPSMSCTRFPPSWSAPHPQGPSRAERRSPEPPSPAELPFGPQDAVHMHLHDRERRQSRGPRGREPLRPVWAAKATDKRSQKTVKELRKEGQEVQAQIASRQRDERR